MCVVNRYGLTRTLTTVTTYIIKAGIFVWTVGNIDVLGQVQVHGNIEGKNDVNKN